MPPKTAFISMTITPRKSPYSGSPPEPQRCKIFQLLRIIKCPTHLIFVCSSPLVAFSQLHLSERHLLPALLHLDSLQRNRRSSNASSATPLELLVLRILQLWFIRLHRLQKCLLTSIADKSIPGVNDQNTSENQPIPIITVREEWKSGISGGNWNDKGKCKSPGYWDRRGITSRYPERSEA